MNEYDVKRLAAVLAVQAEIEGMKAENLFRENMGKRIAYDESPFYDCARRLEHLATCKNEQL